MATRPKANRGSASAKASRSAPARSPSPKAGPSRDEIKPRLTKAVFDTRPGSGYDDEIQTRYHFPDRYLDEARKVVRDGLRDTLDPSNAIRLELDPAHADPETLALLNAPEEEQERRVVQILLNRRVRDANCRRQVCEAYGNTCAITGLRMVNGGGKA